MTPEERINKAFMDSLPDIVESLKKEVKDSITWQVKNDIAKEVSNSVTAWFQNEMIHEIREILLTEKEGLLASVVPFATAINEQLTELLLKQLKTKLENTWERNKILEALFK